jgi:GNAT superfamily N-acetyltransferase
MLQVRVAETDADVERCYPVMMQLRPHLTRESLVAQVRRQREREGYQLVYVEDEGQVRALAGFRFQEMLARGWHMYVDDLVTDETGRSRGYGAFLMDWLVARAGEEGCDNLDLDSGVQRFAAHRFYFRQRMTISAYHFALPLKDDRRPTTDDR